MHNADDLGFEERASGQKILVLQQDWDPADFKGISSGERVKLRFQSVNIALEVVSCNDANACTGKICGFESSADKINFVSVGAKFDGLVVGQLVTFRPEHIFFLDRR